MNYKLTIKIVKDAAEFNKTCAEKIKEQIAKNPQSVLGLATGGTPVGVYKELVSMHKAGAVDFGGIKTFNLDEYYPIEKGNSQSYYTYMGENLFDHVNINKANTNIPSGEAKDPQAECDAYEEKITKAGGIDYQILGIGSNGHIGFNEPDDFFPDRTHFVDLNQKTIEDNARYFDSIDDVPKKAITMGIKTIMGAKKILLMATGAGKAGIIKEALFGNITPKVPASILQLHSDVTVVLDEAAAAEIKSSISNV